MGSIPLVALGVRPQEQQDPVGQLAKLAQLKTLLATAPYAAQRAQQEVQGGDLDIQNKQYEMAQRSALNKAWQDAFSVDASGKPQLDEQKLTRAISQAGYGSAAQPILEHLTNYHKAQSDAIEAQQKVEANSRDAGGAAGYAILKAQNDPGLATALLTQQMSLPGTSPEHKQMLQQQIQAIQQDPSSIGKVAQQLVAQSDKYSKLQSEDVTAQARALQAKTGADRLSAELPGGSLEPVDKASMQDWMRKNPGKGPSDYTAWKAKQAPQATFNIQAGAFAKAPSDDAAKAPTPDAALKKLDPRMRATVKQVGEYQQKKSEILSRLPGAAKENFNAALDAVYPNYSEQNYDARHKMMLDYTSGKTSQQINAINTAGGHLSVLADAMDALQNSNVRLVNQIANKVGVAVGRDPATTVRTIVHRVGPELAAAYIQGGGGEGERGTTAADFDENMSPAQIKSNLAVTAKLLGSKISSNENQWKTTMERDDFRDRFLSPEAKAAFAKLSPGTKTSSKSGSGKFDWNSFPEAKVK